MKIELVHIADNIWEIPKTGKINVPRRVFASEELLKVIQGTDDRSLEQVANTTHLLGIQK